MDLTEYKNRRGQRHPWEIAKANSIFHIINKYDLNINSHTKILDVGCGDGFTVKELFKSIRIGQIDAYDPNMNKEQITLFSSQYPDIFFTNTLSDLTEESYDIITLFDVVEHIEDDQIFLMNILKYASPGAIILMTAPAFNQLFSRHDKHLSHFRRYSRKELLNLCTSCDLSIIGSGYLFFSLLLVRFFTKLYEKINRNSYPPCKGVAQWNHGANLTRIIAYILTIENKTLTKLSRKYFKAPGLSVWTICKKSQ